MKTVFVYYCRFKSLHPNNPILQNRGFLDSPSPSEILSCADYLCCDNSYFWNFLPKCSRKHTTKPFVIFRTWDTNDPNSKALSIFKLEKIVEWNI